MKNFVYTSLQTIFVHTSSQNYYAHLCCECRASDIAVLSYYPSSPLPYNEGSTDFEPSAGWVTGHVPVIVISCWWSMSLIMFWYCPAAEECLLWGTVAKLEPSYRTSDDRKAFVVRRLSNDRSAFRSTRPLNAWHLTISRENCDNVLDASLISLSSWHRIV